MPNNPARNFEESDIAPEKIKYVNEAQSPTIDSPGSITTAAPSTAGQGLTNTTVSKGIKGGIDKRLILLVVAVILLIIVIVFVLKV